VPIETSNHGRIMNRKTAIVFGGSSGIGEAAAAALLASGQHVTITGRDPTKLSAARARLGDEASVRTVVADALDRGAVRNVFEATGKVDSVVICVSGGKGAGPFLELDLTELRQAFEQKTFAQLNVAQLAAHYVREAGSITFVSAASARSVIRGASGLAAVNGALEAMIPILALELAPIRVNAVSPGIIDTPWWQGMPAAVKDSFFETAAATLPVARIGQASEVGAVIALLATSGFVTGSVYEIDGGCHLVSQ
jgi:NAD(P)-dependent dehydrogenase (short-subunit alcohol dehydrogenase family)